jgi:fructose-1,6-bisphosphatase I
MADSPMTLSEHLARQQASLSAGSSHGASGSNVATVVGRIGRVAAVIAQELAHAALRDQLGYAGGSNVTGDQVKKLDVWGHDIMVSALRETRVCAAVISEEAPEPIEMEEAGGTNALVVCTDPVDGSSNLDVNGSVGTIFSVRASEGKTPAAPVALGPGTRQLAAGYVMYGPATTMVYTLGQGTHGFTLNPESGEFLLTHPDIRIPRRGKIYGINEGNVHSWHPGQRAFVEHLKTPDKPSGRPYSLRYSGAMVADVHRTLLDGGLFMYPADWSDPKKPKAKLRLLYEVAPMGMIVEQAGGRASTGFERVLDLVPTEYHQRAAVILGSPDDVATADEFYRR